ncbi:mucin-5AC [Nylanderia fulva]|uniref:mucin-5AC n=1 Tax=Nylanderia fulva TaxID=613905 RepID=UPI0010FB18E1|nr:mucin-5AC [Nylanderia fulva]
MYGLYRAWFGGGTTTGASYPCLQDTFSPPDTVVRVGNEGEHQFVAHKGVLAAHSGYLKALLASAATTTTTTSSSSAGSPFDSSCATVAVTATNGQSQRPVTSVSVSSIGGEAFAPLLNYMYTGRLEVTLDNVYSVLLATHLLHMPGALEQCRAALLRLRAPPPPLPTSSLSTTTPGSPPIGGTSILRPIPSRLVVGPPLCWPPTTPLAYSPAAPAPATLSHHLPPSMQPLMRPTTVPSSVVTPREKEQCAHYSAGEVSKSPQSSPTLHTHHKRPRPSSSRSRTPEIVSTVSTLPFVAAAAAAFTAFAVTNSRANSTTRTSSPSRSISPAPTSVSRTHSPTHHRDNNTDNTSTMDRDEAQRESEVAVRSRNPDHGQPRRLDSSEDGTSNRSHGNAAVSERENRARSSRRRARTSAARETASSSSSTVFSVIYDIACCDGPVRFHRVLNENYSSATSSSSSSHGSGSQIRPPRNCQLTAESEDPLSENDENGGPATRRRGELTCSPSNNDSSNDGSNNPSNSGCYTCGYCKHTFKSQYCYRKHAKRHLLPPTRINETTSSNNGDDALRQEATAAAAAAAAVTTTAVAAAAAVARGNKREVRLLDLNVQYYPCKICGCKFPSYYFVHKHRKLCHANDEERQAAVDGTNPSSRDANASSSPQDAP